MGLREKVKRELHFMGLGAKVLPKLLWSRLVGWVHAKVEDAKANYKLQREVEAEARVAERDAYREAYKIAVVEAARKRAKAKAEARVQGHMGLGAELAQIGERMSAADGLGFKMDASKVSVGEYVLGTDRKRETADG